MVHQATLSVPTAEKHIAGNVYRLFARALARYQHATPDRLYRHFVDATGPFTSATTT